MNVIKNKWTILLRAKAVAKACGYDISIHELTKEINAIAQAKDVNPTQVTGREVAHILAASEAKWRFRLPYFAAARQRAHTFRFATETQPDENHQSEKQARFDVRLMPVESFDPADIESYRNANATEDNHA